MEQTTKPQSLALICPWFGPWPEWINFYLESCRWNPWVTWLMPTDQPLPENAPPNVTFLPMSLDDFVERAAKVSGLPLNPKDAYKINDYKPMLGEMFLQEIKGYSHFGYTDCDIIYGQLDCELTPERLAKYEIISSHSNLQAGHLTVMQHTKRMLRAWRQSAQWKDAIGDRNYRGFDEKAFGKLFNPRKFHLPWRRYKSLWHEMFSMPDRRATWADDGPNPTEFSWINGKLTEPRNAMPQYAYLHFMYWRSNRYRKKGPIAPWKKLNQIVNVDWTTAQQDGFKITTIGFQPLTPNTTPSHHPTEEVRADQNNRQEPGV